MFNRSGFNRLKFNASSPDINSLSGDISIALNMTGQIFIGSGFSGVMDIDVDISGQIEKSVNFFGDIDVDIDITSGQTQRIMNFSGDMDIDIDITSKGINTFEVDYLLFPGLVLAPGDVLEIDTDSMTAVLNGQNVNKLISDDSEFFKLNPGENTIAYESGTVDNEAEVRILWKNMYL